MVFIGNKVLPKTTNYLISLYWYIHKSSAASINIKACLLLTVPHEYPVSGTILFEMHKLIRAFNLLLFMHSIAEAKQYVFDHAYDPETKYEAPAVHFDNMVGLRYECIQDIQKEITAVFKPYIGGKELIGYADPSIHSNLGDQLLWAGSNKLFQRFGKKAVLHCGGIQSKKIVSSCLDEKNNIFKTLGNGKGVIWFNPGGNWGDLYRSIHNNRLEVWKMASQYKIPFISGPQSIWYDPEKKKGVEQDDEIIQGFYFLYHSVAYLIINY
jgi:hypothetical protein